MIQKLEALSDDQFSRVAPFLEADLESVDKLAALHRETEASRRSGVNEPVLEASEVYARARRALST